MGFPGNPCLDEISHGPEIANLVSPQVCVRGICFSRGASGHLKRFKSREQTGNAPRDGKLIFWLSFEAIKRENWA